MARVNFSIAAPAPALLLAGACGLIPAVPHPMVAALALVEIRCAEAFDDPARGPGWFDSSWELRRGLDVLEGLPENPSLDEWLEFSLRA